MGNLSFDTDERTLDEYFREYGDIVEVNIPVGREGRSLGFGTVQFKSNYDAENAIDRLNGEVIDGRKIVVRVDRKQTAGGRDTNDFERRPFRGGRK